MGQRGTARAGVMAKCSFVKESEMNVEFREYRKKRARWSEVKGGGV